MQCSLVAKRIGNEWEAALIVDGRFQRAFTVASVAEAAAKGLGAILSGSYPENTEVGLNVTIETPEEDPKRGPREAAD